MKGTPQHPCRHKHRSLLGTDGAAYFYRCDACRDVVVLQGGHAWRLRAVPH